MTKITIELLLQYLRNYGIAVHCEMYQNYIDWYSGDDVRAQFFYDRGCVIVIDDYEHEGRQWLSRHIHQISSDAEIDAVAAECLTEVKEYSKKFVNPDIWVVMYYISNGDLPQDKDIFNGWRNFSRTGERYSADQRVRELTMADSELVKSVCSSSLENDSFFGKMLAKDFFQYDFECFYGKQRIFGIFHDGSLVGMATSSHEEQLNLAWLHSIYIVPAYRRMGFGKALALTALSDYPDLKWHYQAAKQNIESIGLARSLGFILEGANLIVS